MTLQSWHSQLISLPQSPVDYHIAWTDHPGQQTPVLWLHGFSGSGKLGWKMLELLDYRPLMTIDLPGHGRSRIKDLKTDFGFSRWSRHLLAILDKLQIQTLHLAGYSMGARLALAFALRYPQRVCSLVLESVNPGLTSHSLRLQRRTIETRWARDLVENPIKFWRQWQTQPLFAQLSRRNPLGGTALQATRSHQDVKQLVRSMQWLGTGHQPGFASFLDRLTMPVLLLTGDEDQKYRDIAGRMLPGLPQGYWINIRETGHAVYLEQPIVLAKAIKSHLQSNKMTSTQRLNRRQC